MASDIKRMQGNKMKSSELLRLARARISMHYDSFVCDAVRTAADSKGDYKLALDIADDIANRIHPRDTVSSWLHFVAGVPWSQLTGSAMRDYRLRWIDSMIAEYKAKGD